jgi:hypothetical protein
VVCVSQSWWDGSITEFANLHLYNLQWLRARRRLQPFDTTLRHGLCFDIYGMSMNRLNQDHGCQNNMSKRKKDRKTV